MSNTLFAAVAGVAELTAHLDDNRICTRCDFVFTERHNLGVWRCARYHPYERFMTPHDRQYRCCNRFRGDRGCVPADHVDEMLEDIRATTISSQKQALIDAKNLVKAKSWRLLSNKSYLVQRIDPVAYNEAISVSRTEPSQLSIVNTAPRPPQII